MSVSDIKVLEDYPEKTIVVRTDDVMKSDLGSHFGKVYPEGFGIVGGLKMEGPYALFYTGGCPLSEDKPNKIGSAFALLDASESPNNFPSPWTKETLAGGKIVEATYKGSYDDLASGYSAIFNFINENNLQFNQSIGYSWEYYKSDPTSCSPEECITMIYIPVETK